jgi:hypothetical protein
VLKITAVLLQVVAGVKYFRCVPQFVLDFDLAHGDPLVGTGYSDAKTIWASYRARRRVR